MNYEDLKNVISIPDSEKSAFKDMIRKYRAKLISTPAVTVERVFSNNTGLLDLLTAQKNITDTVRHLREQAYSDFLIEESAFNVSILKEIGAALHTPREIIQLIINEKLDFSLSRNELISQIEEVCGEYAGRISPYIYELCLSNTQSRRSRAGKTFEAIIYKLYDTFNYPFESQRKIGKTTFQKHGLGKMVDSLLPNIQAFDSRRDKTIIGTMKTTLRERWQEVVEELQRTNLPSIFLLTMDEDISLSKATQMARHNVIIVVPNYVKNTESLQSMRNIISFETYFLDEIPTTLKYWAEQ